MNFHIFPIILFSFIHAGYAKLTQTKTWCEYKITSKRKQKEGKRHEMNNRMFYRENRHGKT